LSTFSKQATLPDLASGSLPRGLIRKIGPYKIQSLLNKGGMSILYLGTHPSLTKPLAIKVLYAHCLNSQEHIQRFFKEAEIISMTNHPNIIQLYGQGQSEHGLYIAMEFIQGVSLNQFITHQSFSLQKTIDILLQLSYALYHLHAHGIIHRDIKPENILMTETGQIKLIDFGIAQLINESRTRSSTIMGTPDYMSPEQKNNPQNVTYATDFYSLGILALELLLGKQSRETPRSDYRA
jgi:serine/threonine protein kinase